MKPKIEKKKRITFLFHCFSFSFLKIYCRERKRERERELFPDLASDGYAPENSNHQVIIV